jgi:hypothetical protein
MSLPSTVRAADDALPALGVTIVNYNTEALTLNCVASLLEQGIAEARHICVVDNLSPDGSGARLAQSLPEGVRLIQSDRNGGFGAGVNIGVAALSTPLVLVLNPDTYFQHNKADVVRRLFATTPDLGVAGLKLINPDGTLQYSARRFYSLLDIVARRTPLGMLPPMRRLSNSHLLKRNWSGPPFQADWVMGTGFVVRRSAFEAVGRMDEGYFLYFEEVDLCARMWVHGWQVMGVPEVELVHEHQRHSQAGIWSKSGQTHLKSMFRFFSKFGVPWVHRPRRARMKSAYLQWRRRVMEGAHDMRTDQSL